MAARVRRVALTGGLASGKSHCLKQFAAIGAPTIDADVLARAALEPGTPVFRAVIDRFGPSIQRQDGEVDRAALATIVFSSDTARRDLESIIHPEVYRAINEWFRDLRAPAGIADVPLLFETGHERDFDIVIVASCRPEQQLARAIARGLSEDDAHRRIAAQMPLAEKARRAHRVIDTSGTKEATDRQIAKLWKSLSAVGPV